MNTWLKPKSKKIIKCIKKFIIYSIIVYIINHWEQVSFEEDLMFKSNLLSGNKYEDNNFKDREDR